MKTLSIIVPVYQNQENLPMTVPKLLSLIQRLPHEDIELLFVNDGSTDTSLEILKRFASEHPQTIRIVDLSRNFGQTQAIQAGLRFAVGEAAVVISADLQEPYETIIEMVQKWHEGHQFIIGERISRAEKKRRQITSNIYWKLVKLFAFNEFPIMGFDFFLVDRQLMDQINVIDEKNTSIILLIYWLGFKPLRLPIARQLRKSGKSQWNLLKKIRLTLDTTIAFTHLPVRIISILSLFTAICAVLFLIFTLTTWFISESSPSGWVTIVCLVLIFGALTLFSFGIVCEYLWRILDQLRQRPPFVVQKVIGGEASTKPILYPIRPSLEVRNPKLDAERL